MASPVPKYLHYFIWWHTWLDWGRLWFAMLALAMKLPSMAAIIEPVLPVWLYWLLNARLLLASPLVYTPLKSSCPALSTNELLPSTSSFLMVLVCPRVADLLNLLKSVFPKADTWGTPQTSLMFRCSLSFYTWWFSSLGSYCRLLPIIRKAGLPDSLPKECSL